MDPDTARRLDDLEALMQRILREQEADRIWRGGWGAPVDMQRRLKDIEQNAASRALRLERVERRQAAIERATVEFASAVQKAVEGMGAAG